MVEKLKACPFCEGKASAPHTRSYKRAISCKNCGACVFGDSDADAIAAWNRRSPAEAEVLEVL